MKSISANCAEALPLGRLGENEYTEVTFDVSAWLTEYPNAEIKLYNRRPTEQASYAIDLTVTGGVAKWTVTSTELAIKGDGKCQLALIDGDTIAKSIIFETVVFDALDGGGDVPEPMEDWQQIFVDLKDATEAAAQEAQSSAEAAAASAELAEGYAEQAQAAQSAAEAAQTAKTGAETAAGNAATSATNAANSATQAAQSATQAEAAKDTITGMTVEAETLPAGSSATASWDNGTLSLGIPRGAQGIQGIQGTQGEQGAQGEKGEKGDTGATGATGAKGDTGATGNGIASVIMNADYTLTITFTDGTEYTTPSIRGAQGEQGIQGIQGEQGAQGIQGAKGETGETGNGIASAVLNSDYTLTLTFTDGTSYTTPSIRGANGVGVPTGGTTGQVMTKSSDTDYDTEWTTPSGGASTLAELTDTNISNPSNNQFLRYNRSTGKWVNSTYSVTVPTEVQPYQEYTDESGMYLQGATMLYVDPEGTPLIGAELMGYLTSANAAKCPIVYVDDVYEDPTTQETTNTSTVYPFTQFFVYDTPQGQEYIAVFGTRVYKADSNAYYLALVSTDGRVPIDGATPAITAVNGLSYKCGTVTSLTITPPANGVCSVRFTSGATPTVLTATGVTFPTGFSVSANTIYDIHISDGLATVNSWAAS